MEDPLCPESTNATIGNFEPLVITNVPCVSNKFVSAFFEQILIWFVILILRNMLLLAIIIRSVVLDWVWLQLFVTDEQTFLGVWEFYYQWFCLPLFLSTEPTMDLPCSSSFVSDSPPFSRGMLLSWALPFLKFFLCQGLPLLWVLPSTMFLLIWGFWLDLWVLRLSLLPFYDYCCPQCHWSFQCTKQNIYYAMT